MPRYFFDIHDGVDVRDDVGKEFPNSEAARQEAVQLASEYAQFPDNLSASGLLIVSARDLAGSTITTVRLVCQIE
jgi:hypothetical protein